MKQLIFVYNAESGKLNAVLDAMHKSLKPETYSCKLCSLTFGTFSEKERWKNFRKTPGLQMDFLHRDEYRKEYASKFGYKFDFPVVLIQENNELQLLVSAEEMNKLNTELELIHLIENRLQPLE